MSVDGVARDAQIVQIEKQIRQAVRDAVNRHTRKPFYWGGLKGYQQLGAIAQALQPMKDPGNQNQFLQKLLKRVEFVLENNRAVAEDLTIAHQWLLQIAACLRYPKRSSEEVMTSQKVAEEMERLMLHFHPSGEHQESQHLLLGGLQKRWKLYANELLFCYDIPGLPQDNLQLEALFGHLRQHQRRISGRKSTRELRDFGQTQVLFMADSRADLLQQIQQVPWHTYLRCRQSLREAEMPRQFFRHLHHDPLVTIQNLVNQHMLRCNELAQLIPVSISPDNISHRIS